MAWMEDGTFAVGSWADSAGPDLLNAQVYHVGESSMTPSVKGFSCFYPPTASHYHSVDGVSVSISQESGELSMTGNTTDTVFGCSNP